MAIFTSSFLKQTFWSFSLLMVQILGLFLIYPRFCTNQTWEIYRYFFIAPQEEILDLRFSSPLFMLRVVVGTNPSGCTPYERSFLRLVEPC